MNAMDFMMREPYPLRFATLADATQFQIDYAMRAPIDLSLAVPPKIKHTDEHGMELIITNPAWQSARYEWRPIIKEL